MNLLIISFCLFTKVNLPDMCLGLGAYSQKMSSQDWNSDGKIDAEATNAQSPLLKIKFPVTNFLIFSFEGSNTSFVVKNSIDEDTLLTSSINKVGMECEMGIPMGRIFPNLCFGGGFFDFDAHTAYTSHICKEKMDYWYGVGMEIFTRYFSFRVFYREYQVEPQMFYTPYSHIFEKDEWLWNLSGEQMGLEIYYNFYIGEGNKWWDYLSK
ncbi:MAG: hypothetical protein WC614_12640 [bacterium]